MKYIYRFISHVLWDLILVLVAFIGTVVLCYRTEKETGPLWNTTNKKSNKSKRNNNVA